MFIPQEPKTLEDFFKDIQFLVPKGYTLDNFILPTTETEEVKLATPKESYTPDSISVDPSTGTTVVYTKKDLASRQSFSDMHRDDLTALPEPMPRALPRQADRIEGTVLVSGGQLVRPDTGRTAAILTESTSTRRKILLKESVGNLPKGTMLCFRKAGLR